MKILKLKVCGAYAHPRFKNLKSNIMTAVDNYELRTKNMTQHIFFFSHFNFFFYSIRCRHVQMRKFFFTHLFLFISINHFSIHPTLNTLD